LTSLRGSLDVARVIAVVVEVDGGVISGGMASIWETVPSPGSTGRRAWIFGIGTDEHHRKQGRARAVLTPLVERLDALGVETAELSATREGELLYRALGFAPPSLPRLQRRGPTSG